MDEPFDNPFSVTRAADFTDEQIFEYWVDLADGSFFDLVQPRLEMPMLILGGKGSGKTHVMRYLSFPLQKLRHSDDLVGGVQKEGYLGIYMRCSGLNSARFRGKIQSDEVWADVFAYYMELWLSQMAVDTCCEVVAGSAILDEPGSAIIIAAKHLFDNPDDTFPSTLAELSGHLRDLQRQLDVAINNCAIDGQLPITIRATSGRLVFGLPRLLAFHLPEMRDILFVYLIDEFENLTDDQQKLVNTLIREKENPCSFKVGARLYGVRTLGTFCADEDNKEGSEFERLPLDARLRRNEGRYSAFAQRLVIKRLVTRGILSISPNTDGAAKEFLISAFAQSDTEGLAEGATEFVRTKYANRTRPYFDDLRSVLEQGLKARSSPGLSSQADVTEIITRLSCSDYPLLEKLNCFMLYQQWSAKHDLLQAADDIRYECEHYVATRDTSTSYHDKLLHWKADLLAQLRRECQQKQEYAGFDTLVELSWGNPRHLLILLKHVLSWACFKNEKPFSDAPISAKAQTEGVKEAADWFYRDARMTGRDGKLIQDAINRLGTLFRSIRYSHKPSECSLSTFSYDPASVSAETRRLIDLAEKWLLLVYVGGQSDRNSERVDMKYQINRMLAPKWDISFSRRGALAIPSEDLDAIFDPASNDKFEERLKLRTDRMTAPFFGSKATRRDKVGGQQTLFETDNE